MIRHNSRKVIAEPPCHNGAGTDGRSGVSPGEQAAPSPIVQLSPGQLWIPRCDLANPGAIQAQGQLLHLAVDSELIDGCPQMGIRAVKQTHF